MKDSKGQLVGQHLENVSSEVFEKYQDIIKEYVRGKQGIYALFQKNRLYYVGLASSLGNRLKQHLKDRHAQLWDRFSIYLMLNDHHMREIEALIMRIASPDGNQQKGRLNGSKNMAPEFEKAYKEFHRREIRNLLGKSEKKITVAVAPKNHVGKQPALAPYVKSKFEIRLQYKGVLYKAIVKKDGSILHTGIIYNSPSSAGQAIKGRATNGWTSWTYKIPSGQWVVLDTLRRK
jgi:hypothetical protein